MTLRKFKKKLSKIFQDNTGCNIQSGKHPCNTCFHNQKADFRHITWLITLALRDQYVNDRGLLLKEIRSELGL